MQIRPVDINHSLWDNTLEEKAGKYHALRLGFRQIKGLHEDDMQVLIAARTKPLVDIPELKDAGISIAALEWLANGDAFHSIGLDRRKALWEVSALSDRPAGMFTWQSSETKGEAQIQLPEMSLSEHVVHDYATTALSLKAHPVSFVREKLTQLKILSTAGLSEAKDGSYIKVAGLVLVRQRPGTAGCVCYYY